MTLDYWCSKLWLSIIHMIDTVLVRLLLLIILLVIGGTLDVCGSLILTRMGFHLIATVQISLSLLNILVIRGISNCTQLLNVLIHFPGHIGCWTSLKQYPTFILIILLKRWGISNGTLLLVVCYSLTLTRLCASPYWNSVLVIVSPLIILPIRLGISKCRLMLKVSDWHALTTLGVSSDWNSVLLCSSLLMYYWLDEAF